MILGCCLKKTNLNKGSGIIKLLICLISFFTDRYWSSSKRCILLNFDMKLSKTARDLIRQGRLLYLNLLVSKRTGDHQKFYISFFTKTLHNDVLYIILRWKSRVSILWSEKREFDSNISVHVFIYPEINLYFKIQIKCSWGSGKSRPTFPLGCRGRRLNGAVLWMRP